MIYKVDAKSQPPELGREASQRFSVRIIGVPTFTGREIPFSVSDDVPVIPI